MLLAAIAAYDPLQILIVNVPGSVSLRTLGVYWLIVFSAGLVCALAVRRLGTDRTASAPVAGILLLVVLKWEAFSNLGPAQPLVLLVPTMSVVLFRRTPNVHIWTGLSGILIVVFALAPSLELAHTRFQIPPSSLESFEPLQHPTSSPAVEDVVVVIFDEHPSPMAMSRDLSVDSRILVDSLRDQGFEVPPAGVATATATFASITDMVELGSPLTDGVSVGPAELADLYGRIGGENRTVDAFRQAGYRYTHLEGGWVGSECSKTVDRCIRRPIVDGTVWRLGRSTIFGDLLEAHVGHPFTHAAIEGIKALQSLLKDIQGNGQHDYLFAHVMLPHFPYRLNSQCQPVGEAESDALPDRASQVECANRQIMALVDLFADSTAVLMTSDHGMALDSQLTLEPTSWTREQIAQRLGAFIAYRSPAECGPGSEAVTVLAMRSLVACALSAEVPGDPPIYKVIAQPAGGHPLFPVLGFECSVSPIIAHSDALMSPHASHWVESCYRQGN